MKIIEDIKTLMVSGAARNKKQRKTQAAQGVAEFKKTLLTALKEVSINGSAELIVTMEQAIVQHDLEYYTNSATMKGSLNNALSELEIIRKKLAIVDDPEKYKATDENFILARNRSKGLPVDEARQSFKSHFARLVNLDKAPLDDLDKQIIEVRKSAIHRAQKQYIERQANTLGVKLAGKKRGLRR